MQGGLQPIQRFRLKQRVRRGGQVVDVGSQHLAVLGEERADGGKKTVELLYRIGKVTVGLRQPSGELRQVLIQPDELLIVLVQCVDEKRQAAHHRKEVATALVQRGQRLRKAVQRGVELLALASQPVGERFDHLTERPRRLLWCRAELGDDVGDAVAQLVPLHRHLIALDRDHRIIGKHRPTLVGRL